VLHSEHQQQESVNDQGGQERHPGRPIPSTSERTSPHESDGIHERQEECKITEQSVNEHR